MFEIITEIHADLSSITEADLTRALRNVSKAKKGQTILGTVESDEHRRLFALVLRYQALEDTADHAVAFEVNNEEEEKEQLRKSAKYGSLRKLAGLIFWNEIKHQLDLDGNAWNASTLGIRHGWKIISQGGPSRGPHAHGPSPGGSGFVEYLGKIIGGGGGQSHEEGDEEPDDD